jgi:DNA-binding NtrC family response regulator
VGTELPNGLKILFADDEVHLCELMRMELPRLGHEVLTCHDGLSALEALKRGTFDVAILDIQMPGMKGTELLAVRSEFFPHTEVVLLTGHASLETAIEALRHGAFDYLTKPCKWAELEAVLNRIAEKRALQHQNLALQQQLRASGPSTTRLVGNSAAMKAVRDMIRTIAPTDCSVLILGETGTGKELVARSLHEHSLRAERPFVPVNCGAIPENLVESELFGHRKGAFTGADQHRKGLVEVADGGTLFLDEVGELDKQTQVKLLRFLESGEVRRVGENEPFRVNVRVLCATNRPLSELVERGEFRQDLYFRINTFEIYLPPLRERREDIPLLVKHLLERKAPPKNPQIPGVTPEALSLLQSYDWPGNVRELANVVERALILCQGKPIRPEHLPLHIQRAEPTSCGASCEPGVLTASASEMQATLRDLEREHILRVLAKHGGKKPAAAKELGISLKTLYNKLHQMAEAGELPPDHPYLTMRRAS